MASEYPAGRAGRRTSGRRGASRRTTGGGRSPSAPVPTAGPRTLLATTRDSVLTGLWTATRDLDTDPRRRRITRAALLLAVVPGIVTQWRAGGSTSVVAGEAPRPAVLGVVGALAAATLAASHRAETAAVTALRRRGVRHAGSALGATLAVVQLVATAGLEAAARRWAPRDGRSSSGQAGSTQR